MSRLWARIIRRQRIERHGTQECGREGAADALVELCREFDIPAPLWLNKHVREFAEFGRTQFLPEHFMEEVPFQRLEIEFIDDEKALNNRNQIDY